MKKENPFKRIVIKIGTALITENGSISVKKIKKFTESIAVLKSQGYNVIIVTSGAVASGKGTLNKKDIGPSIPMKQAYAAIGQVRLIELYSRLFQEHGIIIGQILLSAYDYNNRKSYLNARNTLNTLLSLNTIPIINENDSVAIKELTSVGDNDTLAAMVAIIADADLLILLSNIDGLYDLKNGTLIKDIKQIDNGIKSLGKATKDPQAQGGMITKIRAAEIVNKAGIPMIIANGTKKNILDLVLSNKTDFSLFHASKKTVNQKKCWIYSRKSCGEIIIDKGASFAIQKRNSSLLPSGIIEVKGRFHRGDTVTLRDKEKSIAKGLTNFSSAEIEKIKGKSSIEIENILGYKSFPEVIGRENLILI